jgi:hypothetical protein
MTEAALPETVPPAQPIVARAGRYYRNARYIMVLGILAMGAWFAYDGFINWPAQNRKLDPIEAELKGQPNETRRVELEQERKLIGDRKTDTSIMLNRVLAFALPVVGVAYAAFFLRRSRGEIRLENDTLHVPGHPPVPIDAIRTVDESLWKKKGIALLTYDTGYDTGPATGTIRLDDFIYQQTPVDQIFELIQKRRSPGGGGTGVGGAEPMSEGSVSRVGNG